MHCSSLIISIPALIPFVLFHVALPSPLFGQAATQGGSSHCWQGLGVNRLFTAGNFPVSSSYTGRYMIPGGLFCSATHPAVHDLQAEQRRRSMSMAHRVFRLPSARFMSSSITVSSSLPSNIDLPPFLFYDSSCSSL